jgi:hypothetical protein
MKSTIFDAGYFSVLTFPFLAVIWRFWGISLAVVAEKKLG